MKKQILVALAVLPLVAFAQGGPGPGRGMGPGAGPGPGRGDPERMEKRMRLARTLGLAEALDLEPAQALKLGEAVAKFDDRRLAAHKQLREAREVLRRAAAAGAGKAAASEVDQAIQKALDARAQIQTVDREVLATITKDLRPEQKARAVLFLERFQSRFGPGPMHRGMRNGRGMGMGPGRGMGMGQGAGMGMGPGAGACPNCPWYDDDEE